MHMRTPFFTETKITPPSFQTRNIKVIFLSSFIAAILVFASISSLITNRFKVNDRNDTSLFSHLQSHNDCGTFETDPNPNAAWPRVAWLMSFPNSGTSFTMSMVKTVSNLTTATNYCRKECQTNENDEIVPVHADSPHGPFLSRPEMEVPERYILTKTHCRGYFTGREPDRYVETHRSFLMGCARGTLADGSEIHYDERLVQRAIHLVRDPFDNIVSRFHLKQHRHIEVDDNEWMENFSDTPEGFQRWCADMDKKYEKEDSKSRFFDEDLLSALKDVPCHSEFYEYAQWHRLALDTARSMKVPTLIMHYEDYGRDFKGTVMKLLQFLDIPSAQDAPEFLTGKSYHNYYTDEQRVKVMELLKMLVNPDTWRLLERYDVS